LLHRQLNVMHIPYLRFRKQMGLLRAKAELGLLQPIIIVLKILNMFLWFMPNHLKIT
jgi:hypothetical protein